MVMMSVSVFYQKSRRNVVQKHIDEVDVLQVGLGQSLTQVIITQTIVTQAYAEVFNGSAHGHSLSWSQQVVVDDDLGFNGLHVVILVSVVELGSSILPVGQGAGSSVSKDLTA
jgi:hypothetical protein